jgi:hypothetical protein
MTQAQFVIGFVVLMDLGALATWIAAKVRGE